MVWFGSLLWLAGISQGARPAPSPPLMHIREAPCAIPPVAEHVVWPKYTADARAAETEGYIDLPFTIDTKGRPHSVRVTRSLEGSLDQNAVQALKHWRFKPA